MRPAHYLVTGGASGIGAEVAQRLLAARHKVTVLDRDRPECDGVTWVAVNLAEPASIGAATGGLDGTYAGLANVAGVPGTGGSELTMRVNFLGLRELTDAVLPRLQRGASIVNVASRAGHQWPLRLPTHVELARTDGFDGGLRWLARHHVSDNHAYPYSKEVLRVWTQLKAADLMAVGIRVNVINPGPVATPILDDFRRLLGEERMADGVTRGGGRAARPADIAPVITWLLSEESAWVNGADIAVDGGLSASYVETPIDAQPGIRTEFDTNERNLEGNGHDEEA